MRLSSPVLGILLLASGACAGGLGQFQTLNDPLGSAEKLLKQLDAPLPDVTVKAEGERPGAEGSHEATLGAGIGGEESPTTLRGQGGSTGASGGRYLRVRPGSKGSLFVGQEIPISSGALGNTRVFQAGQGLEVSGVGSPVVDVRTSDDGPGAIAPAIRRQQLNTKVLAPYGGANLGGSPVRTWNRTRSRSIRLGTGFTEGVRRDPNEAFIQGGGTGIPTGGFRRSPVRGSVSFGGSRRGGRGGGGTGIRFRR